MNNYHQSAVFKTKKWTNMKKHQNQIRVNQLNKTMMLRQMKRSARIMKYMIHTHYLTERNLL